MQIWNGSDEYCWRYRADTIVSTDGHLRDKHNCIVTRIDEDSSAYSESFKSGVYQLGVPQGQGDSSAPSTTDPLICGFCLVTTLNTRGKTVEQSIVTWMFAREFITNNRHPGEPQLTNKPCTNGRLRDKHNCIVTRIYEDSSAYSESFKSGVYQLGVPQTDRRTRWNQYTPLSTSLKQGV